MNREKFFAQVKKTVFRGKMTQEQVDGLNNLLNVWFDNYYDQNVQHLAYNLATAYHETAHTMQPIMERGSRSYFNKYNAGTRLGRVLGNTEPGDGYRFRGAGHVQNTGRRNARKATEELNKAFNLGIDLEKNPEKRLDPFISAHSLFLGNLQGWWTGKGLMKYLDEDDIDEFADYQRARYVVNGKDKRTLIAQYAVRFENALRMAGYKAGGDVSIPNPLPQVPEDEPVLFGGGSVIKKGSKGPYVEVLIKALHNLGYYEGTLDDFFWTQTDKAVRTFQSKSGLKADGIVGPKTWAVLERAYDGRKEDRKDAEVAGASIATGTVAMASLVALPAGGFSEMDWGLAALVAVCVTIGTFVVAKVFGD